MTITESSAPRIRLTSQLFAGLLIAALGVLFTLDNLNILRARDVLRYWPAIFLAIGISQLVQARSIATMIGGSIWIVFGSVLLGERLHLISSGLRFWPLLLVAIGVWIVVRSMTAAGPSGVADSSARLSALAVLGGVDRRVTSDGFQGADITAFMGGGKLDLHEAKMAGPEASSTSSRSWEASRSLRPRRGTSSSTWCRLWEDTRTRRAIQWTRPHRASACAGSS
jgi:hypothetical protein